MKYLFLLMLLCLFKQIAFVQTAFAQAAPSSASSKPKAQTLMYVMEKAGVFEVFISAIRQAGLEDKFIKEGPYTVLAPRDAAFANVESYSREKLFSNKNNLKKFVEQHLIVGKLALSDLAQMDSVTSISGMTLSVEHKEPIEIEHAAIIRSDIIADNGVVFMLAEANMAEH